MSGSLHYVTPKGEKGRDVSDALCCAVRKTAKRKDVKIPKSISLTGCGNFDFFISHTTNAMRDLIRSEASKKGLVELVHDGEKWVESKK